MDMGCAQGISVPEIDRIEVMVMPDNSAIAGLRVTFGVIVSNDSDGYCAG